MAANADLAPGPILPERLRQLAPAEGWLTVALVALMAMTVAWSLDDAAWVLDRHDWGGFYVWAAILGTLFGFAGAKAGWSRWTSHLVGAIGAALIVPVMVGSVIVSGTDNPITLFHATSDAVVNAWMDLAVLNRATTSQVGHHLLVIGLLAWSVGQFASYTVFGHRRPLDAVIVVGLVLLANMAATQNDQLVYLVVFTIAAMAVLARSHALDEQTTWARRRIGDAGAVRSLYLRGGSLFIATAVFGSLVLTASASSKPLAGWWGGMSDWLIDVSQSLQRILPVGGNARPIGFGFGSTAVITGVWSQDSRSAVTITVPPSETERFYWRAVSFDHVELNAWRWSEADDVSRGPGDPTLAGLADDSSALGVRRTVTVRVQSGELSGPYVLSPADPTSVDRSTSVVVVGGANGYFGGLKLDGEPGPYAVTVSVPVSDGAVEGALTQNALRAAGEDYPEDILRLYTAVPDGIIPPNGSAAALLRQMLAAAPSNDPFDIAHTMETIFRSRSFDYTTDVRGLPNCQEMGAVECFARYRKGYCLHYATTMAVFLRSQGIPARLAEGFLPGERDSRGVEQIKLSGAHAWVEVYFPGYGWVAFDPTGGGVAQQAPLEVGPSLSAPPSVAPSFGTVRPDRETDPVNQGRNQRPPTPPGGSGTPEPGTLIAVTILLALAVGALAFVAWQRGPRGELTPDGVWRGIGRTAARFGFGPRPHQTVYEYAGSLGEVLPLSKPELDTVARAKVEVAYGRRALSDDRIRGLRDAQRRLRLGLLRLAFRRRDRRGRRGR